MKALLVIDYTNDFVANDGALTCGKPAQDIEDRIVEKMTLYRDNGCKIFVINDVHYLDDGFHPENLLFPKHNIYETKGRRLYGKVDQFEFGKRKYIKFIDKTRYSAFAGTNLDILLRQDGITNIELCGVCTDICILHTAVDAYNLGYNVTVDSKCVASFNQEGHRWALNHFRSVLGFTVL